MGTGETRSFRTTKSSRLGGMFFVAFFAAWLGLASYVLIVTPMPHLSRSWPGIAMIIGVPAAMLIFSCVYLAYLQAVLVIDDFGVCLSTPLGQQKFAWHEAVRYDVSGTEDVGVRVFLKSGKRVDLSFNLFENAAELRDMIVPNLPIDDGQEPLCSNLVGRNVVPIVTMGLLLFFCLAGIVMGAHDSSFWLMAGLMAAITLPLAGYSLTYNVTLKGDLLTSSSCFGSKWIRIDSRTQIALSQEAMKNGKTWQLVVADPKGKKITLTGRMSRFPAFRARLMAVNSSTNAASESRARL